MTKEQKEFIDSANYYTLLDHWRHAPAGDPLFQGETGTYYSKVMTEKKRKLSPQEAVNTSKAIGW